MELRDNPGVEVKSADSPFEELSGVHLGQAWGMASRLTRCSADADDVMQDAFIVAWNKRDQIPADPWPWFCNVITNCARNRMRKNARVQPMPYIDPESSTDAGELPEHLAHAGELRAEVQDALHELNPNEHEAVALCVLGGLSHAEASDVTGTNVNTIKARVRRGLQHLRDKLRGRGSVEAFLALPALPHPAGGLDDAVSRWISVAKSGAPVSLVPRLTGTQLSVGAGALALIAVAAVLLLTNPPGQGDGEERTPAVAVVNPLEDNAETQNPAAGPDADPADDALTEEMRGGLQPPVSDESTPVDETGQAVQPDVPSDPDSTLRDPNTGERMEVIERFWKTNNEADGNLFLRGFMVITKEGKRLQHGHWQYFYDSGVVRQEGQMVYGRKQGKWFLYHRNESVLRYWTYVDGRPEGPCEYFWDDGSLKIRGMNAAGMKTGTWIHYYTDGTISATKPYRDGKLNGWVRRFDRESRLVVELEYRDGKRNGREIEYNPETGRPVRETTYRNNVKDGAELVYHPVSGRLLETRVNRPDTQDG